MSCCGTILLCNFLIQSCSVSIYIEVFAVSICEQEAVSELFGGGGVLWNIANRSSEQPRKSVNERALLHVLCLPSGALLAKVCPWSWSRVIGETTWIPTTIVDIKLPKRCRCCGELSPSVVQDCELSPGHGTEQLIRGFVKVATLKLLD